MTVFTIVDFKKEYWMVVLHPDTQKTDLQGASHWEIPMDKNAIFHGMKGVRGIIDDMIIHGKDEKENDENLWKHK